MGCHTWFYMKMKHQPSEKEVKKVCLEKFRENWGTYADLIFHKYDVSKCSKETQEDIEQYDWVYANILNSRHLTANRKNMEAQFLEGMRSYRKLKQQGIVDDYIMNFFESIWIPEGWPEDKFAHIMYHNGFFYQEDDENYETIAHDLFRVDDYPEDVLHNYDEYLAFVKDPKNKAHLNRKDDNWEWVHERMKEFWDMYPDGIVTFG